MYVNQSCVLSVVSANANVEPADIQVQAVVVSMAVRPVLIQRSETPAIQTWTIVVVGAIRLNGTPVETAAVGTVAPPVVAVTKTALVVVRMTKRMTAVVSAMAVVIRCTSV